jgi:hypothetical protein
VALPAVVPASIFRAAPIAEPAPPADVPVGGRAESDAIPAAIGTDGETVTPVARIELRSKVHARRPRRPHAAPAKTESGFVQALKFKWLRDAFTGKR